MRLEVPVHEELGNAAISVIHVHRWRLVP